MTPVTENPLWSLQCSVRPDTRLYKAFVHRNVETSNIRYRYVRIEVLRLILEHRCLDNAMIFCDQEMENILHVKALHIRQLDAALIELLNLWDNPPVLGKNSLPLFGFAQRLWLPKPEVTDEECGPDEPRYLLGEKLRQLFSDAGVGDPSKQIITISQGMRTLRNYIAKKHTSILDNRNVDVILIQDDPLGQLFPVKGFHFTQEGRALLAKHLLLARELPPNKGFVCCNHGVQALQKENKKTD